MKVAKRYADAALFAHWCIRENLKPGDVAELCSIAERVFKEGEKDCCGIANRIGLYRGKLRTKAAMMGLEVSFDSGLWPEISRSGECLHLPAFGG